MDVTGRTLIRAARLIAERGHCKGAYALGDRLCAMAAINVAGGLPPDDPSYSEALLRLEHALGFDYTLAWNDAPERAPEEVIDGLIAAAYWES